MTNEKNVGFVGKKPDFEGKGLKIWENVAKNGKKYLNVKVLGSKSIPCFAAEVAK